MLDQASKADSYELVEEKETPATKHSRPQKRKPNNRQVVEDTSEEEAGALKVDHPTHAKGRRTGTDREPEPLD